MNTKAIVLRVALPLVLVASSAMANELINPGFESPSTDPGVEYFGAGDGWTVFGGGVFTVNDLVSPPNSGRQSLKTFGGCCSGVYQQFPTTEGEVWNGGSWMYNNPADAMSGGQVAAVNIEWIQADGVTQSAILPFISNGTFDASQPTGVWTLQPISGAAPADAAFARLTLITGDFGDGGPGGAPVFDDAFMAKEDPVSGEDNSFGKVKALFNN